MCVLCNRSVGFLIKHDKEFNIAVSSTDSAFAQRLFSLNNFDNNTGSIIVYDVEKEIFFTKSKAVLKIL
ncbi:MAG: hypothetical protein PHT69_07265, partial [Bacteroidales bacterium]|nr:hypothetical protein [Bacteroidales bacterium]